MLLPNETHTAYMYSWPTYNLLLFRFVDEGKQSAEVARDKLRDLIGVEKFVEVYNGVRKELKAKRELRKQGEKLVAAVNPERHAKRKLRMAAKHRDHKKRKITAMKMGRWTR